MARKRTNERTGALRRKEQAQHLILLGCLLFLPLTFERALTQSGGILGTIEDVLRVPSQTLRTLLGIGAYILPLALVAAGILRIWFTHYLPRRRWTIRLALWGTTAVLILHGLGSRTSGTRLDGGLLGSLFFSYFGQAGGLVVGSILAWMLLAGMVTVLVGPRRVVTSGKHALRGCQAVCRVTGKIVGRSVGVLRARAQTGESAVRTQLETMPPTRTARAGNEPEPAPWKLGGPSEWKVGPSPPPWLEPEARVTRTKTPSSEMNPVPSDLDLAISPSLLFPQQDPHDDHADHPSIDSDAAARIAALVEQRCGIRLVPNGEGGQLGLSCMTYAFRRVRGKGRPIQALEKVTRDIELELGRTPVSLQLSPEIQVRVPLLPQERQFVAPRSILDEVLPLAEPSYILGRTMEGAPFVLPIKEACHVLVAGTTGSGKTTGLMGIVLGLVCGWAPSEIRICLADHKRDFSRRFAGVPHLARPPAESQEEFSELIRFLRRELKHRTELKIRSQLDAESTLVTIVDEFQGFCYEGLMSIVAEARAFRMFFIMATQHPTADIIDTNIKSNLDTRISFRVTSESASHLVLGASGATQLLGKGDSLVRTIAGVTRVQATTVSEEHTRVLADTRALQVALRPPERKPRRAG